MRPPSAVLYLLGVCVIGACATAVVEPATSTSGAIATLPAPAAPSTSSTSPSTTSTTSTLPTTTTADPTPICRPDPFDDALAEALETDYRGKQITAYVYDLRSDCEYSLNPDNRQLTASVFKVMVMAGTLLEAQEENRGVTNREMDLMVPMITESANGPVRSLWRSFGGSPWYKNQAEIFQLEDTTTRGDDGSSWGGTRTSARDQVNLLRQVLLGDWGPLEFEYRHIAFRLMTSVVDDQTWGVTAGVPEDWLVAQKNGFAGSIINSVGWVDEPGASRGYVVAILTRGWPNHPAGIAAVERLSGAIAAVMTSDR